MKSRGLRARRANAAAAFSRTVSVALLGWPELNGGRGSYSIINCATSAASRPAISADSWRARSSPAETPAAVQIFPDLTIRRSGTAIAPKRLSDACAHQWVVASCPSRRLAAARISAPEHHTDAVIVLVSCALFNHSTNRPSPIAVAVLASEPGARMRNRCGVSSKECVAPMIRACDR